MQTNEDLKVVLILCFLLTLFFVRLRAAFASVWTTGCVAPNCLDDHIHDAPVDTKGHICTNSNPFAFIQEHPGYCCIFYFIFFAVN